MQLENQAESVLMASKRVANRKPVQVKVEFVGEFDILEAESINLSETGMCFDVKEPLVFEMRFELQGQTHNYRAQLVWAKREDQACTQVGVEFVRVDHLRDF